MNAKPKSPSGPWRRLVSNFLALTMGEGMAGLLGAVGLAVLARRLEPEGFGVISLGTTLVIWFSVLMDSGTEVMNMRNISRDPHLFKEIVEPVLGLRLAIGALVAAVMAGGIAISEPLGDDRTTLLLFALVLPGLALNLRWMGLGIGAARAAAVGNALVQLIVVGGIILMVNHRHDGPVVPVLRTGAELFFALFMLAAVSRRQGLIRPRIDKVVWWSTLKQSLPIMGNSLSRIVVFSFDLFLIALILRRRQAGFYGAASRPVLFSIGFIGLFSLTFLSAYSGSDEDEAHALLLRAARFAMASIPLALGVSLFADPIVRTVYGPVYGPSAVPLAILIWVVPILAVTSVYGAALIAHDRQVLMLRNNLTGALANIAANLVMVPVAGITGAAVTGLCSHLLIGGMQYRTARSLHLAPPLVHVLTRRAWRLDRL